MYVKWLEHPKIIKENILTVEFLLIIIMEIKYKLPPLPINIVDIYNKMNKQRK